MYLKDKKVNFVSQKVALFSVLKIKRKTLQNKPKIYNE